MSRIERLEKIMTKDLVCNELNQYETLRNNLMLGILQNSRSIEDQRIETELQLKELESRNLISEIALAVSTTSVIISCIFNIVNIIGTVDKNRALIVLIVLLLAIVLFVCVWYATGIQKKKSCKIIYLNLKLECIDYIKKHNISKPPHGGN